MPTIRIAIVGAGYMAREHASAFASVPSTCIVGFCSRSRPRAAALAATYGASTFDDIDSMYRETQADAVVVAVNELSTREVCRTVFRHPWVCLLEKPAGVNISEAAEIVAYAGSTGARVYVALNRRSYAATRRALSELATDNSPRLISILDQQDMASAREGGQPETVVRNYMYANSIHLVDYLSTFGRGDVDEVQRIAHWTPEHPSHVVATVRYTSGDVGVYQAVWDGPGPWSVTVTNRAVRVEMRPLERLGIQLRGERHLTEVAPDPSDLDFKPGLRYQAEQLLATLEGAPSSLATLSEATRSMALCADIYGLAR